MTLASHLVLNPMLLSLYGVPHTVESTTTPLHDAGRVTRKNNPVFSHPTRFPNVGAGPGLTIGKRQFRA
jgi:hypothetical protein